MSKFSIAQTIQSMIDSNAGMVFYYTHSRPELKRTVHPIAIVGKIVACVETDTGKHKNFKLDGINFPVEEARVECEGCVNELANQQGHMGFGGCLSEECIEDEVKELSVEDIIREHISNRYTFHFKYFSMEVAVIPTRISGDMMVSGEGKMEEWYLIDNIKPIFKPKHAPKIIGKRHFFDCGYGWDNNYDVCECGQLGATYVFFDDGHKEILNNM